MSDPYIRFDKVAVAYGDEVLFSDLDFTIDDGEFVCILGPSGCGKSTTLRLVSGLLQPAAGTIGVDGRTPEEAYLDFAFVFQTPRLVAWRNALRNVTLASELRRGRADPQADDARALALLQLVGLGNEAHKRPAELSGGERQRVALARALHVEPRTILMDEPFSALDVRTREGMRREIVALWQLQRKTVIFVTHDIDEALFLADRILVFSGKPTRLMRTVSVTAPRLRDIDGDPALQELRRDLYRLLREEPPGEPVAREDA